MGALYGLLGEASSAQHQAMGNRLLHRGFLPSEIQVSERCWLGSRAHGNSSGVFRSGHLAVASDATLFNHDELRAEIEASGYRFESQSINETFLAAFRLFGHDCFRRFHGDFAIAVWDESRQALTFAIDPMDTRPLYFWRGSDRLAFASEYKALLALDDIPAEPDRDAIQHLQHTKFTPPNRTLLKDVHTISPGCWTEFTANDVVRRRFWRPSLKLRQDTEEDFARRIRIALQVAVRRRIQDLDTVGINLSGGIDSTSLLGILRHVAPDMRIHTFTAGFGPEDPEMQVAAMAAEHCNSKHHAVVVAPERIPEVLPRIIWYMEDPIARSEVVFNYELAATSSRYVDTVLIGYGADDTFAGMPKYKILKLMQWVPPLKRPLAEFYDYTQSSALPSSALGRVLQAAYYRGTEPMPPQVVGSCWRPTPSTFPSDGAEFLNRYLVEGVSDGHRDMAKNERLHTAQGLTLRYPLQDFDLVSLAFEIPDRFKLRRWREKHILREAVRPYLPGAVISNPKFPSQMRSDLEFSDVLSDYAHQILDPKGVAARGLFHPSEIERLLKRPMRKPYPYRHAMRIWTAISTELWAQTFLDRRGDSPVVVEQALRSSAESMQPQPVSA